MNITCFPRAFSSVFSSAASRAQAVIPFNHPPHFYVPIKTPLSHLTQAKQAQLHKAVEIILDRLFARNARSKPITIILFGSYARGDHQPQSAFDLLVVTKHEMLAKKIERKRSLYHCLERELATQVNLIAKDVQLMTSALNKGKYFYTDILDEGIVLHSSLQGSLDRSLQGGLKRSLQDSLNGMSDSTLAQSVSKECRTTTASLVLDALKKRVLVGNRKSVAQNDFKHWFEKAMKYKEYAQIAQLKDDTSEAAFFLHQSVEHFYNAVLLVFSRYKPRSHHLGKLGLLAASMAPPLVTVFSQQEPNEAAAPNGLQSRSMLELLNSAYVNARYSQSFTISQAQLSWLFERVGQLQNVVNTLCHARIASYEALLNKEET